MQKEQECEESLLHQADCEEQLNKAVSIIAGTSAFVCSMVLHLPVILSDIFIVAQPRLRSIAIFHFLYLASLSSKKM